MATSGTACVRCVLGVMVALLMLVLAGCKSDLYSSLSEEEANEMLAVLMSNGISAEKSSIAEKFVVRVEDEDMVRAIETLRSMGYPKTSQQSIGTVFQKSGIISSPFEERVRYIYALGQEVAQTLSQIDGVVKARVHVVLPDQPQLGQAVKPSSAAVFIKHQPNVDLEFLVPQIRRLVSSSIEGLDYAAVTVVLTESMPPEPLASKSHPQTVTVLPGLSVTEADVPFFWRLVYGVGAILLLLLGATGFVGFRFFKTGRKVSSRREADATTLVEPS